LLGITRFQGLVQFQPSGQPLTFPCSRWRAERRQNTKLDQHPEFISGNPFFRNLSLAESENDDSRPTDWLPRYIMATETTGPFSAIHSPMTQPARHAIILGYQVVDGRAELAVHLENLSQSLLKGVKASDRFLSLRPMNKAIYRHNFVKNI
jgi:hypothetical protein